jgi:hypothetical protein
LPLVIFRRTGPDWPDEPISKGKAAVCFDLLRKPGSALAMTTSHGVRGGRDLPAAGEQNVQLQVDGEGAVSAWNGAQWRPARAPHAADRWTTIRLELDYAAATIAVEVGGRTRATLPFDPSNLVFDGLAFACSKGEVLLDNVQVRWSW